MFFQSSSSTSFLYVDLPVQDLSFTQFLMVHVSHFALHLSQLTSVEACLQGASSVVVSKAFHFLVCWWGGCVYGWRRPLIHLPIYCFACLSHTPFTIPSVSLHVFPAFSILFPSIFSIKFVWICFHIWFVLVDHCIASEMLISFKDLICWDCSTNLETPNSLGIQRVSHCMGQVLPHQLTLKSKSTLQLKAGKTEKRPSSKLGSLHTSHGVYNICVSIYIYIHIYRTWFYVRFDILFTSSFTTASVHEVHAPSETWSFQRGRGFTARRGVRALCIGSACTQFEQPWYTGPDAELTVTISNLLECSIGIALDTLPLRYSISVSKGDNVAPRGKGLLDLGPCATRFA